MPQVRDIEVHDYNGHVFIRFLENLFGTHQIDKRLQQITRELNTEKGIYLEYWVKPNRSLWLGLKEARDHIAAGKSLAGSVTERMFRPIEIAAKLTLLKRNMPLAKLDEFRSRILCSDYLEPVLYELDTAAHFWQLGYDIHWLEHSKESRGRSPEFIAKRREGDLEVECKSESADSGRRIIRPRFYRLVDALLSRLPKGRVTGKVLITVPNRMPTNDTWQKEVVEAVSSSFLAGNETTRLADGTEIKLSLRQVADLKIIASDIENEIRSLQIPFSHIAMHASREGSNIANPIIVRINSQSDDQVLESILDDLRDANRQLTGTRAGLISCFVPEIESFEGLQKDSALVGMTRLFFDKHAQESVYAVAYSSDSQQIRKGQIIFESSPAIFFLNGKYDLKFGDGFPLSL